MTPEEYLAQLDALMAHARRREAVGFSSTGWSEVSPPLTPEQREQAFSLMEIAATLDTLAQDAPTPGQRSTA